MLGELGVVEAGHEERGYLGHGVVIADGQAAGEGDVWGVGDPGDGELQLCGGARPQAGQRRSSGLRRATGATVPPHLPRSGARHRPAPNGRRAGRRRFARHGRCATRAIPGSGAALLSASMCLICWGSTSYQNRREIKTLLAASLLMLLLSKRM
jgi:hypothetical protein